MESVTIRPMTTGEEADRLPARPPRRSEPLLMGDILCGPGGLPRLWQDWSAREPSER